MQANAVVITPARKKSITKVRPSIASEELVTEPEIENNIESGEDETPKKNNNKVSPVKRSTVSPHKYLKNKSS
jgi:hypothetical protein